MDGREWGRRQGGHEHLRQGSGQGTVVAGTEISPGQGPHVTTHFGASDNINVFSYRPGGQMPKYKASAGLYSFWMAQGRLFPGRFQFLGSWPFLRLQSTSLPPLALLPQLFFSDCDLLVSLFKHPWDYIGPTKIIRNHLPSPRSLVTPAKPLLLCRVT